MNSGNVLMDVPQTALLLQGDGMCVLDMGIEKVQMT